MASALLLLCPGVAQPGWLCWRAWEPQKHHHPQHVPVPLDHSWFIVQPDENKGCSAHNCLQFRHVLYFLSPCIELANDPTQCVGLNCNCTIRIARSVLCSHQRGEGRWDPISRNSRKTVVSKIFFIMVFCFCHKLIHICSS